MSGTTNPSATSEPLDLQQLKLDGFRRLEGHSPAMLLPRLVMTQHLHQSLARSRGRLADSHRMQMKLLGETVEPETSAINLQGDTINHIYQSQKATNVGRLLGGGLTVAALVGLAAWLYGALNSPPVPRVTEPSVPPLASAPPFVPPQPAARPQDWRLGINVTPNP